MVRPVTLVGMTSLFVGCAGNPGPAAPGATIEAPARRPAPEPVGTTGSTARAVLSPAGSSPVTITVELAVSERDKERGLMYRRHLPPDAGMLFVYDRMEHRSFWMRNTWIPLDIIFIDDRGRVVGVVPDARPRTDAPREVEGSSQYVLEVNAGFAARHAIGPGTRVGFEGVPGYSTTSTAGDR